MQIIIVAGGGGSRLWPLSTPEKPKQFIPIVNNTSSLEKVYSYISKHFPKESIWINTNEKYKDLVLNTIPSIQEDHILTEPVKWDNFAAVAVQAAALANRFGDDEPLVFTTSDEFFLTEESAQKFVDALKRIDISLQNKEHDIVTMGIKPVGPNTNYGYVELHKGDVDTVFKSVVDVCSFKEKPTLEKAQSYLLEGKYVWNKFNPSFTYRTLQSIINNYHTEHKATFARIRNTGIFTNEQYQSLPKTSFDFAVMEKAKNMGITALDIEDWVDVGNWEQAYKYLPTDTDRILELEGGNNKLLSHCAEEKKKISFVGVNNLLVVETDDKILIIDPKHSAQVKKVTEHFEN
jgi:mannose-1-phosphate guanylyltransferase